MIKYVIAAAALKLFSTSSETKGIYRLLGNTIGQRNRKQYGLEGHYVERMKRLLAVCERYEAIKEGDRLLEVGTGWLHWESTIIRLFYDVEITLFDVWDNRQLGSYKRYFRQLEDIIDSELALTPRQHERVYTLLRTIAKAESFDEIYNLLDFHYVINPGGTLKQFQDEYFNAIVSCSVLEHIHRGILPEFIQDFYRVLKPGGYSIQHIDPKDHLAYYDHNVSRKNYLRYSDKVWRRYFENDVQYFNRVQRPEWLELFQQAGFELVEEETKSTDIGNIKVDRSYECLSKQDLQCGDLSIVHQKRLESD